MQLIPEQLVWQETREADLRHGRSLIRRSVIFGLTGKTQVLHTQRLISNMAQMKIQLAFSAQTNDHKTAKPVS